MRRLLTLVTAVAALLFATVSASAQFFNHASLGIGVGGDGLSIEAGVPMGSLLQLRVGGSFVPPFGINRNFENVKFTGAEPVDLHLRGQASLKSFNAMLDFFPGKRTKFHFTAGLFACNGHIAKIFNTEPYLEPEDWGSAGIQVGDVLVTTDEYGTSEVNLDTQKFMPYFGIGAGRACSDRAVSLVFDLGACYCAGGLRAGTWGTNVKTGQREYIQLTSADVNNKDEGWIDKVAGYSKFLPLMKFTLFFKLF